MLKRPKCNKIFQTSDIYLFIKATILTANSIWKSFFEIWEMPMRLQGERTKPHWDKAPLGQNPTGQNPTANFGREDKTPLLHKKG